MDAAHGDARIVTFVPAAAVRPLRLDVLRPGMPPEDAVFPGDDDPQTAHAAILDADGEAVAAASIYRESRPNDAPGGAPVGADHVAETAWRMRGVATAASQRRTGAGTAVLAALDEYVREQGGTLLWCNARIEAVAFYESLGWHVLGDEFEIPTVGPHLVMERQLD